MGHVSPSDGRTCASIHARTASTNSAPLGERVGAARINASVALATSPTSGPWSWKCASPSSTSHSRVGGGSVRTTHRRTNAGARSRSPFVVNTRKTSCFPVRMGGRRRSVTSKSPRPIGPREVGQEIGISFVDLVDEAPPLSGVGRRRRGISQRPPKRLRGRSALLRRLGIERPPDHAGVDVVDERATLLRLRIAQAANRVEGPEQILGLRLGCDGALVVAQARDAGDRAGERRLARPGWARDEKRPLRRARESHREHDLLREPVDERPATVAVRGRLVGCLAPDLGRREQRPTEFHGTTPVFLCAGRAR